VSSDGCKVPAPNAGFLLASMPSYCRFKPIECSYSESVPGSIPQDKIRGSAILMDCYVAAVTSVGTGFWRGSKGLLSDIWDGNVGPRLNDAWNVSPTHAVDPHLTCRRSLLLQGVVKQHPSPQMTCFAMLDSEEPWQGSIPDRGQLWCMSQKWDIAVFSFFLGPLAFCNGPIM